MESLWIGSPGIDLLDGIIGLFCRLLGVLDLLEVHEGMGRVISLVRALAEGTAFPAFSPTSIMGRVQDRALDLAYACLDQDFRCLTHTGKEMIGLGSGRTPSGDDFLGGGFNPVMETVLRVAAIGHSSGWDMLVGAVTEMLMVKT